MFKSKHSGWTWDLKRTPFGGGGGFLASIDPIEALKNAANSVADTSHKQVDWTSENGWMLPIALVAGAYAAGEMVGEAAVAGAGGATAADGTVFAAGELVPAGTTLAEGTAIGAGEGALTTGEIASSGGFTPVSGASFGVEPGAAYTTGAVGGGAAAGGGGGTGAFTDANLGYTGAAQELGLEGSTTGLTDLSGTQGSAMLDSMGLNTSGMSASDIATNANRAKNIAKMLSQGSNSGLAKSLGQLAQGQTGVGMAIPAILRGNQNPFLQTAQQPIRNAQPMDLSSLANLLKQG